MEVPDPSTAVSFRVAGPADAPALAAFGARVFRETFHEQQRAEDIDAHCRATFGSELQRRELDAGHHYELALLAGELAGYAQLRAAPPPAYVTGEAPLQLNRLYIDRRWHGRRVAQALLARTSKAAVARGARTLYLAVWEHNRRAIAFYVKHGFVHVGDERFMVGVDRQVGLIMTRPVFTAPEIAALLR